MTLGRWLAALMVVTALGGGLVVGTSRASAEPALPYVAYGVGLSGGQTVEAFVGTAVVGRATTDAAGRWRMQIEPGAASNGDRVTFAVDGHAAEQSVIFASGRFALPPGISLGSGAVVPAVSAVPAVRTAPAATAHPAQARVTSPAPVAPPTTAPRASATASPALRCTLHGRPIACAPVWTPRITVAR
jgi:hypothetical protein